MVTRLFLCFYKSEVGYMKEGKSIRTQNLYQILLSKYLPSEEVTREFNTVEFEGTFLEKSFLDVYSALDGKEEFPYIKFKVELLEFGRFCIMLDEAIHFNRYRAKTLRSEFYNTLTSFPLMKYRSYCRKYEVECIKAGTSLTAWTNDEAEAYFGPSQQSGDLGLSGSSGWKMTAFKDFVIDLIARKRKIRLLRIAVWDDLMINKKLKKFNELLISPGHVESELILKYIERKLIGLYADDF